MKYYFISSLVLASFLVGCSGVSEGACCDSKISMSQSVDRYSNLVAPEAKISLEKIEFEIGESIGLDGALSTDSDGTIVQHAWKVGSTDLMGVLQDISFDTAGSKLIYLTVTDNDNLTDREEVLVNIKKAESKNESQNPIAKIDLFSDCSSYTFSCSSSYDQDEQGESIVKCDWDIRSYSENNCPFRDCSKETEDISVTPCGKAQYIIATLTVTDNEGETDVETRRVELK